MIVSCQKQNREANRLFTQKKMVLPGATIHDIKAYYTLKGNVSLILEAPVMEDYSGNVDFPYQMFPKNVHITILNSETNEKTFITADTAVLYKKTELTELIGKVKIRNEKEESLTTSHLFWDKKNDHIFTDKKVIFKRKNEYIRGTGFDSNMKFTNARVNNVEGLVHVKN